MPIVLKSGSLRLLEPSGPVQKPVQGLLAVLMHEVEVGVWCALSATALCSIEKTIQQCEGS